MSEAKINGNTIEVSFWVKTLLSVVISFIMATTAYAYIIILPTLTSNVIENDKLSRKRDSEITQMVHDNRLTIAELKSIAVKIDGIIENQQEFKQLLKRTIPH